jgi:hypothetical protein
MRLVPQRVTPGHGTWHPERVNPLCNIHTVGSNPLSLLVFAGAQILAMLEMICRISNERPVYKSIHFDVPIGRSSLPGLYTKA